MTEQTKVGLLRELGREIGLISVPRIRPTLQSTDQRFTNLREMAYPGYDEAVAQMKVQSVRFGEYQWKSIALAAEADGISAAQFIRDSAFARAVLVLYVSGAAGSERIKFADLLAQTLKDHPQLVAQMQKAFGDVPESDAPPFESDPEPR